MLMANFHRLRMWYYWMWNIINSALYSTVKPESYKSNELCKACPLLQEWHMCYGCNQPLSEWVQSSFSKFELIPDTIIGVGKRREESDWWIWSKHIILNPQRTNKIEWLEIISLKKLFCTQLSVSTLIIAMT